MNNSQFSTQNSKLNFLEILSGFPNQKIAVIGDLILDKYLFGDVDRISPEAPVPIVKITGEKYVPGGAANVAANIATLQGQSYLFGMVGNDPNQEILKNKVAELGINIDGILIDPKKQTIRKTRVLGMNQQLLRIDYEDTNYIDPNLENEFISKLQQIENLTAIIISDYAKGTITQKLLEQIISYANRNEIALIIDPKPKHKLWYKNAFLVTPNKKEAQEMSGISIESEQDYYEAGKKLVQELSSHVIITAGAE
nr:PfkB family carbohydrate kinase [Candidatus Cloacimonadota bacterium]